MNAKISLINDWDNKRYYLVTLVDNEEITIEITEQQFGKYKMLELEIEDVPF